MKQSLGQNNETNETDQIPTRKVNISDSGSSSAAGTSISGSVILISKNILDNRYSSHNQGPFDIHIQWTVDPKAPLHPITVCRILSSFKNEDILEIKRAGYSKVSVFLKTKEAANNLVEDQRLQKHNLITFIPPFRTSRKTIIRNVPLDLTEKSILESANSLEVRSKTKITIIFHRNTHLLIQLRSLLKDKEFLNT